MNGLDATRAIRALEAERKLARVPIVRPFLACRARFSVADGTAARGDGARAAGSATSLLVRMD